MYSRNKLIVVPTNTASRASTPILKHRVRYSSDRKHEHALLAKLLLETKFIHFVSTQVCSYTDTTNTKNIYA